MSNRKDMTIHLIVGLIKMIDEKLTEWNFLV